MLTALYVKDYGVYGCIFYFFIIGTILVGSLGAINKIIHNSFWDWDLTELASLVPLFILAALIHSGNICLDKERKKSLLFTAVYNF